MAVTLPDRLIVPLAESSLDTFDPDPLAVYITAANDSLGEIARRFYGAVHADLLALLADANGIRPTAVLPAGVRVTVPQPLWRAQIV